MSSRFLKKMKIYTQLMHRNGEVINLAREKSKGQVLCCNFRGCLGKDLW